MGHDETLTMRPGLFSTKVILLFLVAGVVIPIALARANGSTAATAEATDSKPFELEEGLPPDIAKKKRDLQLSAQAKAKGQPPSVPPADLRPRLSLPTVDTGTPEAQALARALVPRLLADDQKLLILEELPERARTQPVDAAARAALPAYRATLRQRTEQVWAHTKAAERAKQREEQTAARVEIGGFPQADDARFEVVHWHPVSATATEIVGSVDGWINQRWINPIATHGSISVDASGWQVPNDGLIRTYQFRLVHEPGGWRLDTVHISDRSDGQLPPNGGQAG